MDNKSKWIIVRIIAVALVVGLTLGAVAVTLIQRAAWGYPPAYAANNFTPSSQGFQNYAMPGPMVPSPTTAIFFISLISITHPFSSPLR